MMDIDSQTKLLYDNLSDEDKLSFKTRYESQSKKGWIYYLFLVLLGRFGANRFYLNQIGMGILYLLTSGLFLIGLIYDLFTGMSQVRSYNERLCARLITDYQPGEDFVSGQLETASGIPDIGL